MAETCSKCGKKVSIWKANYVDNKVLCGNCYNEKRDKTGREKAERKETTGIGGWLLVYTTLQVLLLCAWFLGLYGSIKTDLEVGHITFDFILFSILFLIWAFYLYLEFSRRLLFVSITLIFLYLAIMLNILVLLYYMSSFNIVGIFSSGLGVGIVYLWIKYFKKSKRILFTFK